jgi:hypothetical protein
MSRSFIDIGKETLGKETLRDEAMGDEPLREEIQEKDSLWEGKP